MAFERFPRRVGWTALGLAAVYMAWVTFGIGVRNDHFLFTGLCLGLYFGNGLSRKVVLALFFFAIYWVLYDSMRIFPNYALNPVHIREPYEVEKMLFGFPYGGERVTLNEYFAVHTHPVADLLAGIFYLCWVPVPLLFAGWLFFRDRRLLLDFSLTFLLVNLFGFLLYYLYPAAPPWYVEQYGFLENFDIPGHEAGLAQFDRLLGITLFHDMYSRNANVFAAIPSLHAAYPLLTFYFGLKKKLRFTSWLFLIILAGIWWAAVYTRHHYLIDVLLGACCTLATILVYESGIRKTWFNRWMDRYASAVG